LGDVGVVVRERVKNKEITYTTTSTAKKYVFLLFSVLRVVRGKNLSRQQIGRQPERRKFKNMFF